MKFTCEKALLVSALSVASRTVAQKSTIPCLEGVLLRAGVALQLTGYNLETGITNHTLKFVVPAAGLKEIERILEDSDEPVTFTLGDKHILFSIGDALLVSRVLEGEFIDWRRVVPTNCGTVLTANVAELTSSIERVSLIISEKVKSPVRCVFGDNMADFRTANTIGSAHDTCSIAGNGGELEIGFNSRYLLDALRVIPSEEVTLELQNGLSPIVFTPCDKKYDFAYMVLPVRLRSNS